jgi:hypothetical protein
MKLTRKLLEEMILNELTTPVPTDSSLSQAVTTKPLKKTATTLNQPSEDPTKEIVDKKRYIDLQNKANELNNKIDKMSATDLINNFRQFLSEVASL